MDLVFNNLYIYYIFILLGRLFQTWEIRIRETRIWQNVDFGLGVFKRLDIKDFCPCMPRKFFGREKIWGILFSSLTWQGNAVFPF